MKKTIIFVLIATVMCLSFVLSSCTTTSSTAFDVKTLDSATAPLYVGSTRLSAFDEYSLDYDANGLIKFSKLNAGKVTYHLYDVLTDQTIASYYDANGIVYFISLIRNNTYDTSYYYVRTRTGTNAASYSYKYELFDRNGKSIDSFVDSGILNEVVETVCDLVSFNGKCYRLSKNGTLAQIKFNTDLGDLPTIDTKCGKYYYDFDNNSVSVYNSDLNLVCYYEAPAFGTVTTCEVLDNGNIFVQYVVEKFETDKDYDFIIKNDNGTKKYDLYQKVISASNGKITSVSNNYYISFASKRYEEDGEDNFPGYNKKYVNLAYVYPIENKYLLNSASEQLLMSLSNSGKLGDVLNRTIKGETVANVLGKDRLLIFDAQGSEYLTTFKGKVIGRVDSAQEYTSKYIVGQKNIYDYSLKQVYDFGTNGYEYYDNLEDALLFKKELNDKVGVYAFTGENMRLICDDEDNFSKSYAMYTVKDCTNYTLYNRNGDSIMTSESAYAMTGYNYGASKHMIVRVQNNNKNYFYVLN